MGRQLRKNIIYICTFVVAILIYITFYMTPTESFSDSPAATTAYVCVLHPGSGFFSEFFFICKVYLFAKERNSPFFIEHDGWQYTYKDGWHDYFKSLNVFKDEDQFKEVKKYRPHIGDDIPEYTIQQYIDCIKEIFILNDDLQQRVDDYMKQMQEYTSLYVRRGDKINEMALISIDEILSQTDIQDDGRTIFLQTDDFSVVSDIRNRFPSCNIMTLTPDKKKGADNTKMTRWKSEQIRAETEELLISCSIFVKATKGWTYYHSNVGTFHKLSSYDKIELYVDSAHSKESVENVYKLDHKGPPYALI
jgi:hypothetical protein